MEGKVILLAYTWAPNGLIFKYFVEFREVVSPKRYLGFGSDSLWLKRPPINMILPLSVNTYTPSGSSPLNHLSKSHDRFRGDLLS